jgi:hypothetical protein
VEVKGQWVLLNSERFTCKLGGFWRRYFAFSMMLKIEGSELFFFALSLLVD